MTLSLWEGAPMLALRMTPAPPAMPLSQASKGAFFIGVLAARGNGKTFSSSRGTCRRRSRPRTSSRPRACCSRCSRSTSSECWPSQGAGLRIAVSSPVDLSGSPIVFMGPIFGMIDVDHHAARRDLGIRQESGRSDTPVPPGPGPRPASRPSGPSAASRRRLRSPARAHRRSPAAHAPWQSADRRAIPACRRPACRSCSRVSRCWLPR